MSDSSGDPRAEGSGPPAGASHLDVSTSGAIRLSVLDQGGQVLGAGNGALHVELDPGVYKVRARSGRQLHEELVVCRPGGSSEIQWSFDELGFATTAAVPGASNSDPEMLLELGTTAPGDSVQLGQGALLHLVIRRPRTDAPASSSTDVGASIVLLDARGNVVIDLGTDNARQLGMQGDTEVGSWRSILLEIDPGNYRLRQAGDPDLDQVLSAPSGWDVYIALAEQLQRHTGRPPSWSHAGEEATVVAGPAGQWSWPPAPDLLIDHEYTRAMLATGGESFKIDDLTPLLAEDGRSTQVLMAALGFLRRRLATLDVSSTSDSVIRRLSLSARERQVLSNVATALAERAPDHPDVGVLMIGLGLDGAPSWVGFPPMLAASWDILVRASLDDPSLVPPESLSAAIATRVWGGSAWLRWTVDESVPVIEASGYVTAITSLADFTTEQVDETRAATLGLSAEEALMVNRLAEPRFLAEGVLDRRALAVELGVPPASVELTAHSAFQKLAGEIA